jgi:hypothetical protein
MKLARHKNDGVVISMLCLTYQRFIGMINNVNKADIGLTLC